MSTENTTAAQAATAPASSDAIQQAVQAGQQAEVQRQETQNAQQPGQTQAPAPGQTEGTATDTAASTDAGDNPAEAGAETPQDERKRNNVPARERIKQLTDRIHSQGAVIAELTNRLQAQPQQDYQGQPGQGQYQDPYDDGYDEDTGLYDPQALINQATDNARRTILEEQRQQAIRDRQEARQEVWNERSAAVRETAPDFDQVTTDPTLPIPPHVAEALMSADNGPQVAYYLGKNRAEAANIARMDPVTAAIHIGGLSQRLGVPPVPKTTQAPPPPSQVTGAGNAPGVDPGKLSMDDYSKWRRRNQQG